MKVVKPVAGVVGRGTIKTTEVLAKASCYAGEGTCIAASTVAVGVACVAIAVMNTAEKGEVKCRNGRELVVSKADQARACLDEWLAAPDVEPVEEPIIEPQPA